MEEIKTYIDSAVIYIGKIQNGLHKKWRYPITENSKDRSGYPWRSQRFISWFPLFWVCSARLSKVLKIFQTLPPQEKKNAFQQRFDFARYILSCFDWIAYYDLWVNEVYEWNKSRLGVPHSYCLQMSLCTIFRPKFGENWVNGQKYSYALPLASLLSSQFLLLFLIHITNLYIIFHFLPIILLTL